MHWHHRTIRHLPADDEAYLTVHEFFHEHGRYTLFTTDPVSPQSKEEALQMAAAFDRPPVVEIEDATGEWRWLEPEIQKAKNHDQESPKPE